MSGEDASSDDHGETTASSGESGSGEPARILSPTLKSSLLWGVVGGLTFLVLVQGYELLAAQGVSVGAKVGVTLVVAVVAAVMTHVARDRFPAKNDIS